MTTGSRSGQCDGLDGSCLNRSRLNRVLGLGQGATHRRLPPRQADPQRLGFRAVRRCLNGDHLPRADHTSAPIRHAIRRGRGGDGPTPVAHLIPQHQRGTDRCEAPCTAARRRVGRHGGRPLRLWETSRASGLVQGPAGQPPGAKAGRRSPRTGMTGGDHVRRRGAHRSASAARADGCATARRATVTAASSEASPPPAAAGSATPPPAIGRAAVRTSTWGCTPTRL